MTVVNSNLREIRATDMDKIIGTPDIFLYYKTLALNFSLAKSISVKFLSFFYCPIISLPQKLNFSVSAVLTIYCASTLFWMAEVAIFTFLFFLHVDSC